MMHLSVMDGAVIAGALVAATVVRLAVVAAVVKLAARAARRSLTPDQADSEGMRERVRRVIGEHE